MTNRLIQLLILSLISLSLYAQKLRIESMQATSDLSASQHRRADRNNESCGLVKVSLATTDATFEGNVIQPVEYKTGEYWVYMTKGSRELRIKHPNYVPLHVKFADYGIKGIQSLTTYSLTLLMPQIAVLPVDNQGKKDYNYVSGIHGKPNEWGLTMVCQNNKYGYVDNVGNVIIPLIYDYIDGFGKNTGLSKVCINHRCGFIDVIGRVVIPITYDNAWSFDESCGLAMVSLQGKRGIIDTKGHVVLPIEYDFIKWTHTSVIKSAPQHDPMEFLFGNGLLPVQKKGKWGYIDQEGNIKIPIEYADAHSFKEGLAAVVKKGKIGFIDTTGTTIIPFIYDDVVSGFEDECAWVRLNKKWGIIDKNGNVLLEFKQKYPSTRIKEGVVAQRKKRRQNQQ